MGQNASAPKGAIVVGKFTCHICHESKQETSNGGTGYATNKAGSKICYACCAGVDIQEMKDEGKIILYLTKGPENKHAEYSVTNWPGTLRFPVILISSSWQNFAGMAGRNDFWFKVPLDPYIWHGYQIGDNDIAHCRRTKKKKL